MPVEVMMTTQTGNTLTKHWDGKAEKGTVTFESSSNRKLIEVDPHHRLLEIDYWNNRSPRKLRLS